MKRVLGIQRQGRQQVADLEIRAGEIGLLDQLDLDHLRGVELNERQVVRTLSSRTDGLPMQILALREELENNRLSSPDVQRRMEAMLKELDRLDREQFPVIARELTAAIKSSQIRLQEQPAGRQPKGRVPPDPAVRASLAAAGKHQDQVIATLETLIGELGRWDSYRRFHREIAQLQRDEEELGQRTTEVGRRTLAKEIQDLLPQESADLKINARQQAELAGQWDHVQQEMQSSLGPLQESDPAAAKTVAAALHRAQDLAIGGQMRSAGDDIQQNQMGRAIAEQKQVIGDLQQVLDVLADRRESEHRGAGPQAPPVAIRPGEDRRRGTGVAKADGGRGRQPGRARSPGCRARQTPPADRATAAGTPAIGRRAAQPRGSESGRGHAAGRQVGTRRAMPHAPPTPPKKPTTP